MEFGVVTLHVSKLERPQLARVKVLTMLMGPATLGCVRHAGEKRHLSWLRHYLVAATRGGQPSTAAGSAGAALHIYDLRNKLVAASLPLPEVRTAAGCLLQGFVTVLYIQHGLPGSCVVFPPIPGNPA